jgi:anti-sigma regulatory factor (Ser/Thr protein kinase)
MPRSGRHSIGEVSSKLHLHMPRELAAVRWAAEQFRRFLATHSFPVEELWACELAFVEACNNAVQHAPEGTEMPVRVDIHLSASQLEIRLNDHAPSFEFPAKIELPRPEQEGGRGLFLIQSLMDQVRCERVEATNCLVLRKNLVGI